MRLRERSGAPLLVSSISVIISGPPDAGRATWVWTRYVKGENCWGLTPAQLAHSLKRPRPREWGVHSVVYVLGNAKGCQPYQKLKEIRVMGCLLSSGALPPIVIACIQSLPCHSEYGWYTLCNKLQRQFLHSPLSSSRNLLFLFPQPPKSLASTLL